MKNACTIKIVAKEGKKTVAKAEATSVCAMWKQNKAIFAEHPAATLHITKDGAEFMKLHLVEKSNGKSWMKNDIAESRRQPKPKVVEGEAAEAAEAETEIEITEAAE